MYVGGWWWWLFEALLHLKLLPFLFPAILTAEPVCSPAICSTASQLRQWCPSPASTYRAPAPPVGFLVFLHSCKWSGLAPRDHVYVYQFCTTLSDGSHLSFLENRHTVTKVKAPSARPATQPLFNSQEASSPTRVFPFLQQDQGQYNLRSHISHL